MMRKFIALSVLIIVALACDKTADDGFVDQETNSEQTVTDRNLNVAFLTSSPNGEYAPNHILALWIEKEDGTFVRSLKVRASERKKYLYTWKAASSSDETDAITGPTIRQHSSHSIDWNLLDASKEAIPNGNYTLNFELTDANRQGPVASLPFVYTDSILSQSFDDQENFKNIVITYTHTKE